MFVYLFFPLSKNSRQLATVLMFFLGINGIVNALPQDIECTILPTAPTTCYITTPFVLQPLSTLNIVDTGNLENVTRFELRAYSNLNRIPAIVWAKFPKLQEIIMANYSVVDTLSTVDFLYAANLMVLSLQGNRLLTVPYSTFALAPKLEQLDLSMNLITEIEDMAFNGLDQLKVLDLSYNRLGLLKTFTFAGATNLQYLDLSHNKIKLIDDGTFHLPALKYLNMNTNDLKVLPDNVFGVPGIQSSSLVFIDFGDNKLAHIGSSLYNLREMEFLNLTNNKKIDDINLAEFAKLPKLEQLSLSSSGFQFPTPLTVVPPSFDAPTTPAPTSISPLKVLDISKNKLANPDVLMQLAYFRRLEVLRLNGNKFTYFDYVKALPTWFPSLRTIYVGENKLNCEWLNITIPVFREANVTVLTVKKIKTWSGTVSQEKVIDMDDCVDLGVVLDKILWFLGNKITPLTPVSSV